MLEGRVVIIIVTTSIHFTQTVECKEHWTIRTITIRSVGIIQPIRYNKFSITNYISCEFQSWIVDLENRAEVEERIKACMGK